jgi:peptide/nickel transport system permease protein
MILGAITAPHVAPYHPLETDFAAQFSPPALAHWLGTGAFGRDLLSHLIYGSRTALLVGFASAFVGATLGALMGVASAYFGGRIDLLIQRLVDLFLAFPIIILTLAVVSILGTGVGNVIMAITVPMIPNCARVVRASALAVRQMPYVDAARAAGCGHGRIIFRHMLPNVLAPYLIMLTAYVGQAILLEASLSFLGLGGGRAYGGLGTHAQRCGSGICRNCPVDGYLPGAGHQPGCLCLQSLWRLPARRLGPQATGVVRGRANTLRPQLFLRAQGSTAAPPERAGPKAGVDQRGDSGAGQAP